MTRALSCVAAASLLSFALLASSLVGCAKNEAIVCDTQATNTAASCTSTYDLCSGVKYELVCDPAPNGVLCKCNEDGLTKVTFVSNDMCNVTPDMVKARAKTSCGWKLD